MRNAGVDADTGAERELQQPHGARRGRKLVVGILRVEPGLHGVAELGRAFAVEGTAAGDEDLQLDQVDAGGDLGDRVLDLQPGVDLEEREDLLLRLVEVLDGAGAAVSGGADKFGRHASKMVGLLLGQYRGAGFLDHLLVPALDGAVAHSRRPDIAVVVGDHLDLDVAGIGDKAFEEHHRVAERTLGFALRALERDFEFVGGEHLADAAAAATTTGFDDQRVADGLCVPAGVLAGLDGATAPRCERNAHLLGQKFGLDLVAQCAHRGGGRPDERELQARAELCEGDVFGDETPAHPHRVGLGFQQSAFELGVVEVGDAPRGAAERHRFVSLAYEHGPALGVGMKSDGRYAAPVFGIQFSYGPNEANRGLTPVDHCDSFGKLDCQLVGFGHSLSV